MDYSFFLSILRRNTFNLKKYKTICSEKLFSQPEQVTGSTYSGIITKLFISQRYAHILEENWKNSVHIGLNNFANLKISKLYDSLY